MKEGRDIAGWKIAILSISILLVLTLIARGLYLLINSFGWI